MPIGASSNNYLLNTYYVPVTVLSTGRGAVNNKEQNPCPHGAYISRREDRQANKYRLHAR